MSKKVKTFTPAQIARLPDEGYWLEHYGPTGRPTAVCIKNGKIKYIHCAWGEGWHTLLWTCCFTRNMVANPPSGIFKYEHFKTHEDMIAAHPNLDAAYQTKAPNDF